MGGVGMGLGKWSVEGKTRGRNNGSNQRAGGGNKVGQRRRIKCGRRLERVGDQTREIDRP